MKYPAPYVSGRYMRGGVILPIHITIRRASDMEEIKEISFPPGMEERAITYAAYDILRQLCEEGRITETELKYLAVKYKISIAKEEE